MGIHESYYEVLYAREVVRLSGYAARHRLPGTLYAYLAYGGATLSAKDALAQGMLANAQEKGFLKPGQPVVECSSGTFAVALAIACSHSGHPLVLCVPGSIGPARQKLLTELGAKLAFTTGGRTGAAARAQAVAMRTGGYFLNYFDNDINAEFHRRVTGPAIVKATGGELDAIVVGVGSGGTITVGRALGYTREAAVRLSFLMAIPAVFGSGLLEAIKAVKNYKTDAMFPGWGPTLVAMVISFVLGYIVIIGFLKFVSNFSYKAFAIYRIGLAVVVALLLIVGVLPAIDPSVAAAA